MELLRLGGHLTLGETLEEGESATAKGTRQVLGGLSQIAMGVNELRNDHGTGHGRATVGPKLGARHARLARLAAGAATVLATVMIDTLHYPSAPWRKRQVEDEGPTRI